ncbi:peptidase S28 [Guyanagaster necrorhizus]|uniref:Peptidase S28 n=1 Tax=Guyanagaster necrorhizus TaxID=856835 RepID=A0A9P8ANF7_9AGAR|nr:peptidase S28 [Guyanagaster necrorhizus MCA 3950]KAG7441696.1 peptidase S28 [Guyanagaster necrorhizus MCA 3950]
MLVQPFLALVVFSSCVVVFGGRIPAFRRPKPPGIPKVAVGDLEVVAANARLRARDLPPYDTIYYFDQLIDHDDPSMGTFQQRYWHSAEFYEAGGPIILMNAGEVDASSYYGYVTNSTINGVVAQQFGGAAIVLEHRYFGESNPFPNLDVDSLEYLTIAQTIEDHVYFAQNVVLPQDNGDSVGPDKAPWILMGGSYPGGLVSWTMAAHPDIFWIGYASSAVVQIQLDFWQYYEPIRENMPMNCSADVEAVIAYVDGVFTSNDTQTQSSIQRMFGFTSNLEVAQALRWDLWTWQDLQPNTGPGAAFYQFCDALEVKDGVSAPESGWGVDNALSAWANWFAVNYEAETDCASLGVCPGSLPPKPAAVPDKPAIHKELEARVDYPVDDATRSWSWLECNEIEESLDGPPIGQGGIVSRLNTWQYDLEGCVTTFPDAFSTAPLPDGECINTLYGGWGVKNTRLFFANGKRDPWRESTVSAVNSTAVSTDDQPIGLSDGFHCSDLVMALAAPDDTVVAVQNSFLAYVGKWLPGFVAQ